ncbi:hypothetical protein ACFL27_24690 [candidate division CSSED10-310 bacterium]|uniref:Uncharacterized protein n=1 Tax=candidate division CSSED10-310 bacterium TaxID=2855610 RepID=A0ABV6Z4N6_UNCC1
MSDQMFLLFIILIVVTVLPGLYLVLRNRENPQKFVEIFQELVSTENFQRVDNVRELETIKSLVAGTTDGVKVENVTINHALKKKSDSEAPEAREAPEAPEGPFLADVKYYHSMQGGGRHYLKSVAAVPGEIDTCDIVIYPQPKSYLLKKMVSAVSIEDAISDFNDQFMVTFIPMREGKISLNFELQRLMIEYVSEYPFNQPQSSAGGSPASLYIGRTGICAEGNRTSDRKNLLTLNEMVTRIILIIKESHSAAIEQ